MPCSECFVPMVITSLDLSSDGVCVANMLLVLTLLSHINCWATFLLYHSDLYIQYKLVMQQVNSPLCSRLIRSILLLPL
jgi:hypothetical protein